MAAVSITGSGHNSEITLKKSATNRIIPYPNG